MTDPQLLKVTDNLYYFESRTVSPFAVSGVYLIVRDEVALIEAGTSISAPHLLEAIEALGHYLPEFRLLYPAVAPPGFDLEASRATIEKSRAVKPARICFSQFGWREDPEWVFSEISRQLEFFAGLVKTGLDQGLDVERILDRLKDSLASQGMKNPAEAWEMLLSLVLGYKMYFERQ